MGLCATGDANAEGAGCESGARIAAHSAGRRAEDHVPTSLKRGLGPGVRCCRLARSERRGSVLQYMVIDDDSPISGRFGLRVRARRTA